MHHHGPTMCRHDVHAQPGFALDALDGRQSTVTSPSTLLLGRTQTNVAVRLWLHPSPCSRVACLRLHVIESFLPSTSYPPNHAVGEALVERRHISTLVARGKRQGVLGWTRVARAVRKRCWGGMTPYAYMCRQAYRCGARWLLVHLLPSRRRAGDAATRACRCTYDVIRLRRHHIVRKPPSTFHPLAIFSTSTSSRKRAHAPLHVHSPQLQRDCADAAARVAVTARIRPNTLAKVASS
ncbi:hypothetical protein RJ55_07661 [Drechmeria coniospora]|nr:hypothetical protein RJ55_07661 [Drechmeria coniospora]